MIWDESAIATLKRMWADGKTMLQIGEVLGCTRSAVAGKIKREGLTKAGEGRWVPLRYTHATSCRYCKDGLYCNRLDVKDRLQPYCKEHFGKIYRRPTKNESLWWASITK